MQVQTMDNLFAISIHAPRAGGDFDELGNCYVYNISIHAPRAGGDRRNLSIASAPASFQSTPPVRGATHSCMSASHSVRISIHAPRAGGDQRVEAEAVTRLAISIHAPVRGRPIRV